MASSRTGRKSAKRARRQAAGKPDAPAKTRLAGGTARTRAGGLTAEERNELILAAAAEGIYEWTPAANELYVSPRLREMLGFKLGELTSENWFERVHPEDKKLYRQTIVEFFKGSAKQFACVYRTLDRGGRYRWISDRATAVRGARGRCSTPSCRAARSCFPTPRSASRSPTGTW